MNSSLPSFPIIDFFQTDISICSWNIHGNLIMKIEDSDFLKHISPYDVIFLSECWFSKTTCSSLELSGFKVYCKARSRKKKAKRDSGGLCVLIKNSINCYFEVLDWENEDGLIFKVDKKKHSS